MRESHAHAHSLFLSFFWVSMVGFRSIVTVHVTCEDRAAGAASLRRSKLSFVDLAGSECLALSNATGAAAQETAHINKSLSALADVIMALGYRCPSPATHTAPTSLTLSRGHAKNTARRATMCPTATPSSRTSSRTASVRAHP